MSFLGSLLDKVGSTLHLPEFGLSEAANGGQATQNTANPVGPDVTKALYGTNAPVSQIYNTPSTGTYVGPTKAPAPAVAPGTGNFASVAPPAAGVGAVSTGGSAAVPASAYGPTPAAPVAPGQPGGDQSILSQIEAEFQNHLASLGGYENSINNNFGQSQALLSGQNDQGQQQLNTEQQNQTQDINNQSTDALNASATQQGQSESQLRQYLQQLQQRNNASLSTGGNFNSSLADATNEAYGKTALQGISGILQNRQQGDAQIRTQTTQQLHGLSDFYNKSRANLGLQYQQGLQSLVADRDAKLSAIADQKNQAATAKSAQSLAAWQDYLSQKRQIDLSAYQSQQALAQFNAQKQSQLAQQYQTAKISLQQTTDPLTGLTTNNQTTSYNVPTSSLQSGGQVTQSGPAGQVGASNPQDIEKQLQLAGL